MKQRTGTCMISSAGKQTTPIYMAFHHENPIEIAKKFAKQDSRARREYTAGIIAGKPATKEQLEKFSQI